MTLSVSQLYLRGHSKSSHNPSQSQFSDSSQLHHLAPFKALKPYNPVKTRAAVKENPSSMENNPNQNPLPQTLVIDLNQSDPQPEQPLTLLGFLVADKYLNVGTVVRMLIRSWSEFGDVHVEAIRDNNTYTITTMEGGAAQRILEGSPWNVMGHTITTHMWPLEARLDDVPIHMLSIWVQMHGLTRGQMTLENTRCIGALAGELLEADDPNDPFCWRGFQRARVRVDSRQPLIPGWTIQEGSMEPKWIEFRYERMSMFCFRCGRMGHTERGCSNPEHRMMEKLGVWMMTSAARKISRNMPESDKGGDPFQRQCFQNRQNRWSGTQDIPKVPILLLGQHKSSSQDFRAETRSTPNLIRSMQSNDQQRRSRGQLVISEGSADSGNPQIRSSPTSGDQSIEHLSRDKGKNKVEDKEEKGKAKAIQSAGIPIWPRSNFPRLGLDGDLRMGSTQLVFNNATRQFVPIGSITLEDYGITTRGFNSSVPPGFDRLHAERREGSLVQEGPRSSQAHFLEVHQGTPLAAGSSSSVIRSHLMETGYTSFIPSSGPSQSQTTIPTHISQPIHTYVSDRTIPLRRSIRTKQFLPEKYEEDDPYLTTDRTPLIWFSSPTATKQIPSSINLSLAPPSPIKKSPSNPKSPSPSHSPQGSSVSIIAGFLDRLRLKRQAEEVNSPIPKKGRKNDYGIQGFEGDIVQDGVIHLSSPIRPQSGGERISGKQRGRGRSRGRGKSGRGRGRRALTPAPSGGIISPLQREVILRETLSTPQGLLVARQIMCENLQRLGSNLDMSYQSQMSLQLPSDYSPGQMSSMHNNLQVMALPPLPESIPIIHDPIAPHVEEIQHSDLVDPQIQVQLSPARFTVDNLLELTEAEALLKNGMGGWPDAATNQK